MEVPWTFYGHPVRIRNWTENWEYSNHNHDEQIERLSVRKFFRAIHSAQVVVILVDKSEPKLINMDLTIDQRVFEEGLA